VREERPSGEAKRSDGDESDDGLAHLHLPMAARTHPSRSELSRPVYSGDVVGP
jgi:hypothetical protein